MSNVWLCLPSARPVPDVTSWLQRWTDRGYRVALWRDDGAEIPGCSLTMTAASYPGYAIAVNKLVATVLSADPDCQWVVAAGDDTWPDPNFTADEIARQCSVHFAESWSRGINSEPSISAHSTFGVMQPTGDPWSDHMGRIIERIAGSPWIGREFAQRVNQGGGPYWPEYRHNWLDEEIMLVAQRYGCFWQRRDLTHFHDHCLRYPGSEWAPHLKWVSADYNRMKPVFEARKRLGFPGSNPL